MQAFDADRSSAGTLRARNCFRPSARCRWTEITHASVTRWFDEYSRTAPGGANHVVERASPNTQPRGPLRPSPHEPGPRHQAQPAPEAHPLPLARGSPPTPSCELDRYAVARPSHARGRRTSSAFCLLTGCRRGEILTLRWQDIDEDTLNLGDSKTGPRRVFLSAPARAILQRQPRSGSAYVFPSPLDPGRPLSPDLPLWYSARKEARIEDARLHDLRHTFASHAVLQGIPLPVVSRLLGHKQPSMTLRYAHVGDRETEAAAERIGTAISRALGNSGAHQNE